ncbi:MAG: histidine phosphatase family protein [Firmicutes bacterium]|nr:histidine phosphatase family protein [Bacillota bacterium]
MNRIYFVRHGATAKNGSGIFKPDEHLGINELGCVQSDDCGKKLRYTRFNLLLTSPTIRTQETLHRIIALNEHYIKNGGNIVIEKGLTERDFSGIWGMRHSPIEDAEVDVKALFSFEHSHKIKNVETQVELEKRAHKLIDLLKQIYPRKDILAVTHGSFMVMVKSYIEQRRPEWHEKAPRNGEILTVDNF